MNPETTVVVTGANRGIGFEIARQLAARAAHVILTARTAESGRNAVRSITTPSSSAQFHVLDVTDSTSIAALRDSLERTFGRLDVLINTTSGKARTPRCGSRSTPRRT